MFVQGVVALLTADFGVRTWLNGQPLYAVSNPNVPPAYPYVVFWYFETPSPPRTFDGKVSRAARIQFDFTGRLSDCIAGYQTFKNVLDGLANFVLPTGSTALSCEVGGGMTGPIPKDPSVIKMSQDFTFEYVE